MDSVLNKPITHITNHSDYQHVMSVIDNLKRSPSDRGYVSYLINLVQRYQMTLRGHGL